MLITSYKIYMINACPCCLCSDTKKLRNVSGYMYYQCNKCQSIFIDNEVIKSIDEGLSTVTYNSDYWKDELASSKERSYGAAIARMAEAFYYCRVPIKRFIDIGTGPGYFLDAVSLYLPDNANMFYGIEKYPPSKDYQTSSDQYMVGDLSSIDIKFDAGICIEVIEHLTPNMFEDILKKLAAISNDQALYIFNSGLPEYVLHEDPGYLDPVKRGHIMSYSVLAANVLGKKYGFTAHNIGGKTWAFAMEYKSHSKSPEYIQDRIWSALESNLSCLTDSKMGSILKILGLESSRAYK